MEKLLIIALILLYLPKENSSKMGVIHYGEIQSLGLGAPVGQDYTSILLFDYNRSLYVTRKDSLDPELSRGTNTYKTINAKSSFSVSTNPKGFQYYYDKENNILYSRDIGFNYVRDTSTKINWTITEEEKKIGQFICKKASCSYLGRDYTAWFTKEIPLPYGPWKLRGLPGIILEAYDANKEIYWYFKEMTYPSKHGYLLKPIENGQRTWITFKQYKEKLIEGHKKSIIAARIAGEKLDIEVYESPMSNNYIEVFESLQD